MSLSKFSSCCWGRCAGINIIGPHLRRDVLQLPAAEGQHKVVLNSGVRDGEGKYWGGQGTKEANVFERMDTVCDIAADIARNFRVVNGIVFVDRDQTD